jgi:saccharopine dehydrogenase-like NADP-dependent oxidoreductase
MKRIIVIGVGAQGSTIAKRMDEHTGYLKSSVRIMTARPQKQLSGSLKQGHALQLDASEVSNVIAAAKGMRSDRQRPAAGFQPDGHGSGPGG